MDSVLVFVCMACLFFVLGVLAMAQHPMVTVGPIQECQIEDGL